MQLYTLSFFRHKESDINYALFIMSIFEMDIFQLIGDFLHLLAVVFLLVKILKTRNISGLSYKTQEIYLVVFLSRYVDIFLGWKTVYFFLMKLVFIGVAFYTVYLMMSQKPFCLSYDRQSDKFPHYFLYLAAAVLTLIIHRSFSLFNLIWSYSIWLQALAILPQLAMIAQHKGIQNITGRYILLLGLYRAFYILHWIINWQSVVWTSFLAGLVQTVLYADFFYYFFKSYKNSQFLEFPV